MAERKMTRCYQCAHYKPKSKTKGRCKDLNVPVDAVDFCYEGKPKQEGNK